MTTKTFLSVTLALSVAALTTTGCSSEAPEDDAESAPAALGEAAGGPTGEITCGDNWCTCKGTKSCGHMFWRCKANLYCNYDASGGLRCICQTQVGRTVGGHDLSDVPDLTSSDGFN